MEDKVQMFNMLQDVVTHFSENPTEKRSVPYSTKDSKGCLYNPPRSKPKSIGCAIGMYLSNSIAKKLDRYVNSDIYSIMTSQKKCSILPKWMQEMNPNFLYYLQGLHDNDINWGSDDISEYGKRKVKSICKFYGLDYSKIKFKK